MRFLLHIAAGAFCLLSACSPLPRHPSSGADQVTFRVRNRMWQTADIFVYGNAGDLITNRYSVTSGSTEEWTVRTGTRFVYVGVHPIGGRTYAVGRSVGPETPQELDIRAGDLVCITLEQQHSWSNLARGTAGRCP